MIKNNFVLCDRFETAVPISHGEGIYMYGFDGKKYIDWNSQAMCSNLGHTILPSVKKAINIQLDDIPMTYSMTSTNEAKSRLAKLCSEIFPADIDGFMFPSSGSEANECAIRMARAYTGVLKLKKQLKFL